MNLAVTCVTCVSCGQLSPFFTPMQQEFMKQKEARAMEQSSELDQKKKVLDKVREGMDFGLRNGPINGHNDPRIKLNEDSKTDQKDKPHSEVFLLCDCYLCLFQCYCFPPTISGNP